MDHGLSSWSRLKLPVYVVASHIMIMLDIKDLVNAAIAGARDSGGVLQEVRSPMPPRMLPAFMDRSVGTLLLKHGYSLRGWPSWIPEETD
jgi:hypothetical protein